MLAQDIDDDVHLYTSHNLGFKSGAFNGNGFTNPPVNPELLYATEAGAKTELFDRRVRVNLAYFCYTYKNVEVRSTAPPALPGNALLLNAAGEYLDDVDGGFQHSGGARVRDQRELQISRWQIGKFSRRGRFHSV